MEPMSNMDEGIFFPPEECDYSHVNMTNGRV
jgi:hypothetical protein